MDLAADFNAVFRGDSYLKLLLPHFGRFPMEMYIRISALESTVCCPLNLHEIPHGKYNSLVFFLLTESTEKYRYAEHNRYIYIDLYVNNHLCQRKGNKLQAKNKQEKWSVYLVSVLTLRVGFCSPALYNHPNSTERVCLASCAKIRHINA